DGDGTGDLLVGAPFTNAGGPVSVVPMASGPLGGQVSWSGSAVADGLGTAVVALPDLDGDGRMELAATAPGGASLYGELEVYDSHSGSPIPREAWTGQELHGGFGSAVANLGDADGNGIPTLAVGAYAYGYLSTFGGALFLGETDGTDKNASDLVRMEGATNTQTGWALANVGDVDGDGKEDLLVGSDPYNTALTAELAWLVTAPMAGDLVDVAAAAWERESLYEDEGTVVGGAGDVDGDGYMDLLIGAPNDSEGGFSVGAAFLILGNPSGTESLTDADAKILGSGFSYMQAGTSVAAVPDVDGDGLSDIAIGAPSADDARTMSGSVYLVPGTVRGTVTARTSAHTWWMGESLHQAGWAVGQAGDQDGDGISELWVSSVGYNGQSGAVWGFSLAGAR
ncbi:MAG TPA: integrin alpha, partial [Myxococcota bacterium]|nr:integrin alpha [Myxococcota bacterium]